MNRIGKKIAWVSLSGMMIFSLLSCGKKDNAADETLIDPDYIGQDAEALLPMTLLPRVKLQQQMKVIQ